MVSSSDPAEQRQAVQHALDAGITYFDTAASYGDGRSEENLGRVMGELGAWGRVVVGTKVRVPDLEQQPRAAIRTSLEASLKRLGRADVDVFHLHNPLGRAQLDAVLGEVARGFEDVIQAGLVRHAGFTGLGETAAADQGPAHRPVRDRADVLQRAQSERRLPRPGRRPAGLRRLDRHCAERGSRGDRDSGAGRWRRLGPVERAANAGDPGGVMAGGRRLRSRRRSGGQFAALAGELGLESSLELAVRFGLSKPGVSTVLVGYSNLGHLVDAIRWAERGPLTDDVVQRVRRLAA